MREFDTGATRNNDESELDFEGFYHPSVMKAYALYMHENRIQADGKMRDGDNWQKGIPKNAYMKSAFRHFFDWWSEHRGMKSREGLIKALCGLLFNVQGYLFEVLKERSLMEPDKDVELLHCTCTWPAGTAVPVEDIRKPRCPHCGKRIVVG